MNNFLQNSYDGTMFNVKVQITKSHQREMFVLAAVFKNIVRNSLEAKTWIVDEIPNSPILTTK